MSQVSSASSVSQTQRKMYEAMMDSMAKSTSDYSGKLSASTFSQEAKVYYFNLIILYINLISPILIVIMILG